MENFYPVFLDLRDKKCLVVGGGRVAYRKAATLLACQAQVTVVAPKIIEGFNKLAEEGSIKYLKEPYAPVHLEGAFLVIGSTDNEEVNRKIADDCFKRNILVNIVDVPNLCNFFVPALVNRGPLSIAISTEGKSPAFAAGIRRELEKEYTTVHGEFVDFLGSLRPRILKEIPDGKKRKALFIELAGEEFFNLYKNLSPQEMEKKVTELINGYK